MAYERRDGDGVLYVNDRKADGSKQPDYKGTILIDGTEYWLSGWRKKSDKGQFLSLSAQPKQARQESNFNGGGDPF